LQNAAPAFAFLQMSHRNPLAAINVLILRCIILRPLNSTPKHFCCFAKKPFFGAGVRRDVPVCNMLILFDFFEYTKF